MFDILINSSNKDTKMCFQLNSLTTIGTVYKYDGSVFSILRGENDFVSVI